MSLETIVITLSYLGIFILITINGIVSFPSSQVVYVVAGYFAMLGKFNIFGVILAGAVGNTIGNVILYEISRRKGLKYSLKLLRFLHIPGLDMEKEVEKVKKVFEKKGAWFLFFGKLVNPVKIFIPIPAGISHMNRFVFTSIIFVTSLIWASVFTSLGYFFGKSFENFGIYGIIMIVLVFVFGFVFYKYMNSADILKELEK